MGGGDGGDGGEGGDGGSDGGGRGGGGGDGGAGGDGGGGGGAACVQTSHPAPVALPSEDHVQQARIVPRNRQPRQGGKLNEAYRN